MYVYIYWCKIADAAHTPEVAIHLGVEIDKGSDSLGFKGKLHKWTCVPVHVWRVESNL